MTDTQILRSLKTFLFRYHQAKDPAKVTNCAVASALLHEHLLFFDNFETKLIQANVLQGTKKRNHFYLQLPDLRILDITASQFKFPDGTQMPIHYLGQLPDHYIPKQERDPLDWNPKYHTTKMPKWMKG